MFFYEMDRFLFAKFAVHAFYDYDSVFISQLVNISFLLIFCFGKKIFENDRP